MRGNAVSYEDKQVLIVDDLPDMRTALRSQVASLALEKVVVAGTVRDALEQIKRTRFDIILCDYYLGGGVDGQQFLEYLRTTRIISRSTLFVMITAECGYENVITVAECLPDDYLLKPFTADTLRSRFDRLLEKKARLAAIDRLQDQGKWLDIITACDEIMAAKDKFMIDAMRIKGTALVMVGRFEAARDLYQQALDLRPMPWARLGLARALRGLGSGDSARRELEQVVAEHPTFLAAYDMLGHIHMEEGRSDDALRVLDQACTVSPNSLARHRSIAGIAEDVGDFQRVEKALATVVQKTRNSPLRNCADFARLGNALTELGDPGRAVAVLGEARERFRGAAETRLLAAVEAVAQHKAGNEELAIRSLEAALDGDTNQLPEAAALAVAKACLVHGRQDRATSILTHVVQNNPDAKAVHRRVDGVLKEHGGAEVSRRLIELSVREVIKLNNAAVESVRAGDFAVATKMLTEAAARLPNNLQIVANAAFCLLFDILETGFDAEKLRQALEFRQSVEGKDANHPKLAEIADVLAKIQHKYGSGERS